jgi:hypothetical protein
MKTESLPHPIHFQQTHNFAAGLWRLADPKISLASFSSVFVGACAAAALTNLFWLRFDGARNHCHRDRKECIRRNI